MPRKKKPTYKKDDLIKMIVEWATSGISSPEIRQKILKLGYQTSYYYTLYNEAKPIIRETLMDLAKDRLEETISVMEEQYRLSLEEGERRLANDIRKEINRISGLHEQKIDITSKGDKINQIEVIKIIEVKNEDDEDIETKGEV